MRLPLRLQKSIAAFELVAFTGRVVYIGYAKEHWDLRPDQITNIMVAVS